MSEFKTTQAHNAQFTGHATAAGSSTPGSAGYLGKRPESVSPQLRMAIAQACNALAVDMSKRLGRLPLANEFIVVIDRVIMENARP